jgi:iron complex transport system permease protein
LSAISQRIGGQWLPVSLLTLGSSAVLAFALALTLQQAFALLPANEWWHALTQTDLDDPAELLARHAFAPRIAVSLLAGAGLALSGTILQQALRNPLADPTTLGTSAGASLALTAATVYAPFLLNFGREGVALAGAAAATALTFALAAGRSFNPVALILSGLVVSLLAGSAAATLMALRSDYVSEIYVWQSGSLLQNGDRAAWNLLWQLACAALATPLLMRPLTVLALQDEAGRALGLSPDRIRLLAVTLAVAIAAVVVAAAGVIAFVGLAAPAVVRLAGVRSFRARLVLAPLFGALLLWATDRTVAMLASAGAEVPAGSATALLGAPLILALMPLLRGRGSVSERARSSSLRPPRWLPGLAAIVLVFAVLVSFSLGRGVDGWQILPFGGWGEMASFRLPRIVAAASAGVLLAIAGTLLQRMTGNPMASPEFLGVSGGAVIGVVGLMVFVAGELEGASVLGASALGALLAAATVMGLALRARHSAERLLLTGFFVATFASSLAALMLASGDPRAQWLQLWLTGSTYRATAGQADLAAICAGLAVAVTPFLSRWLTLLPLGVQSASSLGLNLTLSRAIILLTAAAATTVATLTIGPLSFTGLMAPHIARFLGFARPTGQAFMAAAIGAVTLMLADWLGRNLIYPWQVPAGLLAALLGAPFFIGLMRVPRH